MPNLQHKSVDIIIAARNEERFLGRCLEALRSQDYSGPLAIYVVDNGSTDRTAAIARSFGVEVLTESSSGAARARNAAITRSQGELVGFLDAHCIPEERWVTLMSGPFASVEVGGCQGYMENRSINPRVQKYLDDSRVLSNEQIVESTVSGKRNIYPWILSGNCMYRREALNDAGLFNDNLLACEDVELAWRVVLLGYQLTYVPDARLIHYNCDSWFEFSRKGFAKGRGAATLAAVYRPHGAREKFAPTSIWSRKPEKLLSSLYYWAGFRQQELRLRRHSEISGVHEPPRRAMKKFRPDFEWTPGLKLRISDEVVYWFRDDRSSSVIVNIPLRTRSVLDGVADLIWRSIAAGQDRQSVVGAISTRYGVASITAETDLDEFVEELIEASILVKSNSAA